jgi:hypothetical protein
MSATTPGRNDPCPCGSGRKFKQCCLNAWAQEDSARLALRRAEGVVINQVLDYVADEFGAEFIAVAWEEFYVWDDVPEDMPGTPEFDTMFIPWVTLAYEPDPSTEAFQPDWPTGIVALHWLEAEDPDVSDLERDFLHAACRSPSSFFVVEGVKPGRSLDLRDILTGRRFHVLEERASQTLAVHDLVFVRVVTVGTTSILMGMAPFVIPSSWHLSIIQWRAERFRERTPDPHLMTRSDVAEFDIEIRELYLAIATDLLTPSPPDVTNTDGETLVWTTLTFDVDGPLGTVVDRLRVLARVAEGRHGESDDPMAIGPIALTRDDTGALVSASVPWHGDAKEASDDVLLGMLDVTPGRIVASVNSDERAERLKARLDEILGEDARLTDTSRVDFLELAARLQEESGPESPGPETTELPTPEMHAALDERYAEHLESWIDESIPALDNQTPREAAGTALGREQLTALIAGMETTEAAQTPERRRAIDDLRVTLGLSTNS